MKKRRYLLCNLLVVGAILLYGCSSEVMLSEADKEILDTATEEYNTLRDTMSTNEARVELVAKLTTGCEGVESAVLGEDGYTIFIEFSDGDFAGIHTLEPSEVAPQSFRDSSFFEHAEISETPNAFVLNTLPQKSMQPRRAMSEEPEEKITPLTKKVLILCPLQSWEVSGGFPKDYVDYLKEYGWKDDDIQVKAFGENITPADYCNLGEYGIILYFGHGSWRTVDNDYVNFFIQGCVANDALFQNNPQYGKWREQKKLLIISFYNSKERYDIFLRRDLIKEIIGALPSTYVHFATCSGLRAASAFYDNGGKVFLSWDKAVGGQMADANQLNMLKLMLGDSNNVYEAYLNDAIVRSYDVPGAPAEWNPIRFQIYPDPSLEPNSNNFYLPAWINLTVTGIPEGTSSVRASVYDKDSNLLVEDDEEVLYGATQLQIEEVGDLMIAPTEEVRIEARAFDSSNQELDSGQVTTTLNAGANLLQVHLTSESVTAETRGELWGPYTYQESGAWIATAGGDVFAVWKGEERTYTAILYKPGEDPRNRTYSAESVYTKDEIMARFFGENVWKLADDEVAVCFTSYSYTGLPGGTEQAAG